MTITGARNDKGSIRIAICPEDTGFPNCGDKAVRTAELTVADGSAQAHFDGLAPGTYAISVFHDANRNGKLDTFLGIPREGYGFSRNPPFRPRAPKFSETEIQVEGHSRTNISLRYIL